MDFCLSSVSITLELLCSARLTWMGLMLCEVCAMRDWQKKANGPLWGIHGPTVIYLNLGPRKKKECKNNQCYYFPMVVFLVKIYCSNLVFIRLE